MLFYVKYCFGEVLAWILFCVAEKKKLAKDFGTIWMVKLKKNNEDERKMFLIVERPTQIPPLCKEKSNKNLKKTLKPIRLIPNMVGRVYISSHLPH